MGLFCQFCGTENSNNAVYCRSCGKQISRTHIQQDELLSQPNNAEPTNVHPANSQTQVHLICPYCGGSDCHPVVKTDIKTSGGGYSFWNGCCGLILLGPAGLLCGSCGSSVKTKVRNETWWVCKKCGKEFISKQSALEKANLSMRSAALYSLLISMAVGYSFGDSEISTFWTLAIATLVVAGLWGSIPMAMTENSGLPLEQLLNPEEKSSFWTKFMIFCAASVLGGLLFGFGSIG